MELFWLLYPSCYQLIAFIWLIFWTSTLLVFFYSFLLSDVKVLHFCVLLLLYLLTLAGNTVIILLSYLDRHLHKPMYSFLGNLTFLDICYPSTTMPKILQVLLAKTKSTTFIGCLTQLYLFVAFVGTEHVLLLIMSYDRFLAVCQPLRYMVMMSQSVCIGLVFVCWFTGIVYSSVHTASHFTLTFVEPRRSILFLWHPTTAFSFLRQYIYKWGSPALHLGFSSGGHHSWALSFLIHTYCNCYNNEDQIRRRKTKSIFYMCFRFTVIILYYGSAVFNYVRPISTYSLSKDRMISVLYSMVIPMLNLVI